MISNAGLRISQNEIGALFGAAYMRTARMSMAVSGFKCTSIWPINSDIFTEDDFAASLITDEPDPATKDSQISAMPALQNSISSSVAHELTGATAMVMVSSNDQDVELTIESEPATIPPSKDQESVLAIMSPTNL